MDELQKAQERVRKLEAEAAADKAKIETFERSTKEREEADAKAKVKTARETVIARFEKAVKDDVITPGQRDQFTKLLNVDDDDAVLKISTDSIEALLKESGGKMFTKAQTKEHQDDRTEADAGSELTTKAYEIMNNSNGNMSFDRALSQAMKANPELAKEHIADKVHVA